MLGGRKEMCVVTAPCVLCAVRLKHVREKRSVLLDFSYQYFVEQSRAEQSKVEHEIKYSSCHV